MTPREVIAKAWAITRKERKLRRWGFTSSFLETFLNLKLVGYQIYFLHAYLVGESVGFFDDVIWLNDNVSQPVFLTIVISFLLLVVIEFIFPKLAEGAIIGLAAKSYLKEKVEGGLVLGLYNFFPILAIHEIFFMSSLSMTVTICSVVLRYVEGDAKFLMVTMVIVVWAFSNILRFFFTFAKPAVVVRKASIFHALGKSFKLIISNIGHIVFLGILLLVISLRIVINAIMLLVLPGIVLGLGLLLATVLSPLLSYTIAGIVGMILLFILSHFFAYLHVFKQTVWTITYIELSSHRELDVIEG